jgi:stage II sporulation protein M
VSTTYSVPPPPPTLRRNRVSFDRALSKSYWLWRTNPALMVPTMLSTSITVLTQSVFVIFGTAFLIQLESSGFFSIIANALISGNLAALEGILLSRQLLYLMIEYFGSALTVSAVVAVLASGFVYSSEYLSYFRAIGEERVGIGSVFSNLKARWKQMVWTYFLVELFTIPPIGLLSLLGVLQIVSAPNIFSVLELEGLFILGSILTALVAFFLMYSLIAVAVENVSGFSALNRSYHMVSSNFVISLIYAIVTVVSYVGISLVSELATSIGVPLTSLASIAITLLIIPVLHLTKTLVYAQARNPPKEDDLAVIYGPVSGSKDLFGGSFFRLALNKLKQGIYALKNYALNWRNTPYHFASAVAFVLGIILGAQVATHGLDQVILSSGLYQTGHINPTILNNIPLTTGFDIFLHNWEASLSTALSGMWLVAPSFLTLAFNGMLLGIVYYLTPNSTMFAAAIFPHGSIEIPSFIIAGSVGMKLGIAFIKNLGKGKDSPEEHEFEKVARETIYVVIGLAVLFLVAGIIEGNITPIIMKMYGWQS